jgi:hypothetical protein
MFIETRAINLPSSVGATFATYRSYGASGIYGAHCYKHAAPLALKTMAVCVTINMPGRRR